MAVTLRSARLDEHAAIVAAIGRKAGSGTPPFTLYSTLLNCDPRFRPEHLRIAEHHGQIMAAVLVVDRWMRVGVADVRGAIMTPVVLGPELESQEHCAALMRDTLQWARTSGFAMALLWGQGWLLPRYGFTAGLKRMVAVFERGMPPLSPDALTVRGATSDDAHGLLSCYETATAPLTFAARRSSASWEWQAPSDNQLAEVAVDTVRAVRGYARWSEHDALVRVHEIGVRDDGAALALASRLREVVGNKPIEVVSPPVNQWGRWARRHGAEFRERDADQMADGFGLVRVLNLAAWCKAALPELSRRAAQSEFVARKAALRLETPIGTLGILVDRGNVTLEDDRQAPAVALSFSALHALLAGQRPIADLLDEPGVFVQETESIRLLDVLFPMGYPYCPVPPYFEY